MNLLNGRKKIISKEGKEIKKETKISWSLILRTAFLFSLVVFSLLFITSSEAAELSDRRLIISDSRESASNVSYTYQWTGSTTTLKCFKILFCDTWTGSCNTPSGLNTTASTKGSWSGLTAGDWALNNSTNGILELTNSAGETPSANVSLEFLGNTNPGNTGTYYSRIETFSNEACSNSVDSGTVSFTITGPGITVTVTVPGAPLLPPPSAPLLLAEVIFKGRAYPNAFLTILKNGRVAATFFAKPSGLFEKKLTGIWEGTYNFGIWAEDTEGRKSVTQSFTISLIRRTITTISGIFISPTIELFPIEVSRGETLDIFGQVFPESQVNIFISPGEIVKETITSPQGKWSFKLDTTPLEAGEYKVRAKAFFGEGEQSPFSRTLSFLVLAPVVVCKGADLNFDGEINLIDFSILLYFWHRTLPENICADINQDGIVDLVDFSIMMYYWTG